jgi:aminoglycoside 6'-N-acetyltransferase
MTGDATDVEKRIVDSGVEHLAERAELNERSGDRDYRVSLPTSPMVTLRNATLSDVKILELWDSRDHVRRHGGDPAYNAVNWTEELMRNDNRDAAWQLNLIAEVNGVPIGYVAIIDPVVEETSYWGDDYCHGYEPNQLAAIDIWIGDEQYLNRGFGTSMMRTAIEKFCFANEETKLILIDPMAGNVAAHRFYQRLGFVPDNETHHFGPDCCLVHRLSREDYLGRGNTFL